jgi:hypothetical protein
MPIAAAQPRASVTNDDDGADSREGSVRSLTPTVSAANSAVASVCAGSCVTPTVSAASSVIVSIPRSNPARQPVRRRQQRPANLSAFVSRAADERAPGRDEAPA